MCRPHFAGLSTRPAWRRDGRRRGLGRKCGPDQIGSHCRKPVELTVRPTIFDDVLTFGIARFLKSLQESIYERLVLLWRCTVEKTYHRQRRLLRARRERPCGCRAAQQSDELAPSHVEHGASFPPAGVLAGGWR